VGENWERGVGKQTKGAQIIQGTAGEKCSKRKGTMLNRFWEDWGKKRGGQDKKDHKGRNGVWEEYRERAKGPKA